MVMDYILPGPVKDTWRCFNPLKLQVITMGIKENFTNDEWENLVSLPYAVSMTIMVAAPNVLGVWGETKAMMQEPANLAAKSGSLLVEFLILEPNQHTASFFALEKELTNLFDRHVNMVDLTDVTHPDLLRQLTKRKTNLFKAETK